jgi:hypothetical protein
MQPKHETEYPSILSALKPVPHDDSMLVLEPPEEYTMDSEPELQEASPEAGTSITEDQDFSAYSTIELHFITQAELNDLVWDLNCPKTKAQLLGSKLQQWNLLENGVKVSL